MYYQYDEQKNRRLAINRALIREHSEDFEVVSINKWKKFGLKEHVWMIFALASFEGKYNSVIEKIFSTKSEYLDEYHTFLSFMFINLILRFGDKIPLSVKNDMESHIKNNVDISLSSNWDFIGVNDNTPAMIAAALILSGEYFNEQHWIECGKKRFVQLFELLDRREYLSEFNSPTYTPITIAAVSSVAELSRDCSKIALKIEGKLWRQFLDTSYIPVSNSVGAFSRAYQRDKLCQTHNSRALLYMLFEDKIKINPLNTVFNSNYKMDEIERLYIQADMAWMCSFNYHCPIEIAEEFINRTYPYRTCGKAEISSSADRYLLEPIKGSANGDYPIRRDNLLRNDPFNAFKTDMCFEYPCAISEINTYMTEKYALGTCTVDFHSGVQTDSFTLYYTKNGNEAKTQDEIGAVFCNYCINTDTSYRNDGGRKVALQKDNHAVVLYSPTSFSNPITQAKLSIYFSNYRNMIEQIIIQDREYNISDLKTGQKICADCGDIFLKTNSIFCHFKPLVNEKDINDAFVELVAEEEYLIIDIYNYKGNKFSLKDKELRCLTNGFAFDIEKIEDVSFEEFIKIYSNVTVSDEAICNVHNRYTFMREVKYNVIGTNIACCISPVNSGIKYINIK